MADDFTNSVHFGLSDLPTEPPDNFELLEPIGGRNPTGMLPFGAPELIQARYGFPRPRQGAPVVYPPVPAPGGAIPEIPIPDRWRILGTMIGPTLEAYSTMLRRLHGGGGGRGKGRDEEGDDECMRRYEAEQEECRWRDPQHVRGCNERARARWTMCNRNGGEPHPDEPPKWGWADEEGPRGPRKPRR